MDSVQRSVGESLTRVEVGALVARAAKIVELFDRLSAERGESNVLFTLPR